MNTNLQMMLQEVHMSLRAVDELFSTLPAPASVKAEPVIKKCACGRTYTKTQWDALTFIAYFNVDDPNEDVMDAEMRDCHCGSSISMMRRDL